MIECAIVTSSDLAGRITKTVDQNFKSQVAFLSKLVKAKSGNPFTPESSNLEEPVEREVAELIYKKLKSLGMGPRYVAASKRRPNVVCRLGSKRFRKSLIFNGHMDTVLPGSWKRDPYSGEVRGNRLYGLGVTDMKAALTAYVFAAKAIKDLELNMAGRLTLAFVVDEESGACSKWGTAYLLSKGYRGKAALIGEPSTQTVAIGHRGGYRFKLTTKGESVHTGLSLWEKKKMGRNAIESMVKVANTLRDLEIPFKSARLFPGRKPVFTFPTKIEGGVSVNVVPDKCEAYGDVRLMPGNSSKQVRLMIDEKLAKLADVDYEIQDLLFVPAVEIDPKEELVQLLVQEANEVLGQRPDVRGVGPWNDAWMYVTRDIPTICGFGPDGEGAHQETEWVSLKSLKKVTEIYARLALEYLGIKE